jgi:hypothetical protein
MFVFYFSSCAVRRGSSEGFVRERGPLRRARHSQNPIARIRMIVAAFDAQANNNRRNFGQAEKQWLRRLAQPTER